VRIRRIHLLAVPAVLIATGLVAEVAYRATAREQLASILSRLNQVHEGREKLRVEVGRFGRDRAEFSVSLVEDLWEAWLCFLGARGPLQSRLEFGAHAYAVVYVSRSETERGSYVHHAFIWSPRRWRFERFWDNMCCSNPVCPGFEREPPRVP
jgi:hypothetical protein